MMAVREGEWSQYPNVFTMVLTELKHEGLDDSNMDAHHEQGQPRDSKSSEEKSIELLTELKNKMPYLYIHMNTLDVRIMKEEIESTYWERRLIELTKFELEISTTEHWQKMHESLYRNDRVTTIRNPEKSVRFFCGFDPCRVSENEEEESSMRAVTDLASTQGRNVNSSTLKLYLYSRQSGRLIKVEHDPRSTLGLSAGSTDFNQGLTIILDDFNGTIPLNPTKQDTSYGVSATGQIHSDNIREWTAAITHFFWMYHFEGAAGSSKKALSKAVSSRKSEVEGQLKTYDPAKENPFSTGFFIQFGDLHFGLRAHKLNYTIRANKPDRKQCFPMYAGDDDLSSCPLIRLDEEAANLLLQEEAEKKAMKDSYKKRRRDEDIMVNVGGSNNRAHGLSQQMILNQQSVNQRTGAAMMTLRTEIEMLRQQKGVLQQTIQDQANDLATVAQQRDDQKYRADKLEQDMGFLQQQNNHLLKQAENGSGGGDSDLQKQLQDSQDQVQMLQAENERLANSKAGGASAVPDGAASSNSAAAAANESEAMAKMKAELEKMKKAVAYYKGEKDAAKRQIDLLNQEKQRMEARVQQLEEDNFEPGF
ncbi:MAG: hypothetical protein SGARI_001824 [Bacillariaceae sp.]